MMEPAARERLRALPSVEEAAAGHSGVPHGLAVRAARESIAQTRERLLAGEDADSSLDAVREDVSRRLAVAARPSLRRVINATGVILHTNLGRAPLAAAAAAAVAEAATGYSSLELDLTSGRRGSRDDHVGPLIAELCGAEAAIAVNNNAAAVLLALAAHAGGREVIVSRGELVEIGGSFRIPEILEASGATLVEVGTTNRTRLADYEAAFGERTAAILRVHQSNFRMIGFTEEPGARELAELAHSRGALFIHDLGSGAIGPVAGEPDAPAAAQAGADLVCFSADKLLGGPQAGLIVGTADAVSRCRSHPLARALRIDKLQLAALEATLRLYRDGRAGEIPALTMLAASADSLRARAERLAAEVGNAASVRESAGRVGGGALPLLALPGPVCAVEPGRAGGADAVLGSLREWDPPVIARIADGAVILDPRTIADDEVEPCTKAVRRALERD